MEVIFDQHFLNNPEIINKTIASSKINKDDIIFEIGPGKCVLTKEILKQKPKQLISVDIDTNFLEILEQLKKENLENNQIDNFEYIIGNGLEELKKHNFTKLIANIPYSITEPLYKEILNLELPFVILLHGKNFYEIINNPKSKWHYYVNAFYNLDVISEIGGENFTPIAKVDSVLLKLELKDDNQLTKEDKIVKILYSKETRNVKNAIIYTLVDVLKLSKKEAGKRYKEFKNSNFALIEDKKLKDLSNKEFEMVINLILLI